MAAYCSHATIFSCSLLSYHNVFQNMQRAEDDVVEEDGDLNNPMAWDPRLMDAWEREAGPGLRFPHEVCRAMTQVM
jgi:hypothetical protein